MFDLSLRTANAAFNENPGDLEASLSAIFHGLAESIADANLSAGGSGSLYDYNGNRVGEWTFEPD